MIPYFNYFNINIFILFSNKGICAAAMWLGVSSAISVFPQFNYISASMLEEEFKNMRNSKGEIIKEFAYNKGL